MLRVRVKVKSGARECTSVTFFFFFSFLFFSFFFSSGVVNFVDSPYRCVRRDYLGYSIDDVTH